MAEKEDTCSYCGVSTRDTSAVTDLRIIGSRLGATKPDATLHMGPTGFVHLHGWHMYPPGEDVFARHLERALRRRLPSWVLRFEATARRKVRSIRCSPGQASES